MTTPQLIVKMNLDAWNSHVSRTGKLINSLSDEELAQETAPGRNTGTYLLGHLVAVHDAMIPLMNLGNKSYPLLEDIFIKNPDNSGMEKPPVHDLRNYWAEVHTNLASLFQKITPDEWFTKHTAVGAEDFEKEPHRNKLNILISRTNHLGYHLGQLAYLKK